MKATINSHSTACHSDEGRILTIFKRCFTPFRFIQHDRRSHSSVCYSEEPGISVSTYHKYCHSGEGRISTFAKIILLFLTLSFQTISFAQTSRENPKVLSTNSKQTQWNLDGNWKYNFSDNFSFSKVNFDDKGWESGRIDALKTFDEGKKLVWFRYYFKVDSTLINKPLAFQIIQKGASEIYLNGKKIDKVGEILSKGKSIYKNGSEDVPPILSFSNTDVNVIAVRFLPQPESETDNHINVISNGFKISVSPARESIKETVEKKKDIICKS